jgi:hypothetical protein
MPYGLVMVSHCELIEVDEPMMKHTRWSIPIGGKNRDVILNMTDMILFIDSKMEGDKEVRFIRTKPSRGWEAGDRSGKLPDRLPLNYNELVKYFTKEV